MIRISEGRRSEYRACFWCSSCLFLFGGIGEFHLRYTHIPFCFLCPVLDVARKVLISAVGRGDGRNEIPRLMCVGLLLPVGS